MLRCSMCKRPIKRGWKWAWRTCCKQCYRTLSRGFRIDRGWRSKHRRRRRPVTRRPMSLFHWLFGSR